MKLNFIHQIHKRLNERNYPFKVQVKSEDFNILMIENNLLNEANIHEKYNVDDYFYIHSFCVSPDYCEAGIGTALVRACMSKAKRDKYSVCVGLFLSGPSQTIGKTIKIFDKIFVEYINNI